MKLIEYLNEHKLKAGTFAGRIGVNRSTVGRWLEGAIPDPGRIVQIQRETGGLVTLSDWAPSVPRRKPANPERAA